MTTPQSLRIYSTVYDRSGFCCTAPHHTAPTLFHTTPHPHPHRKNCTTPFFYYTDDDFISELLFISIWQSFSQYFVKKLIKIMLKFILRLIWS